MRITNLLRTPAEKLSIGRKSTSGLPPGTLVYTGRPRDSRDVTVHHTTYDADTVRTATTVNGQPARGVEGKVDWFDLRGLDRVELVAEYGQRFGIHPLALEDILDVYQRPKIEIYDDSVLIIVKAFAFDETTRKLSIEQVSIFLSEELVLTFQEDETDLFEEVRNRIASGGGRVRRQGADYLAYALLDNIADRYFSVLDKIEGVLDGLEDTIMREPELSTKARLHEVRLSLLTLRKSVTPLRELANRFGDNDSPLITEDTAVYIRDLRDHIIQITDLVETYRDITNGLYDLYVSEISFRMNQVMQTLTVVSTIFIPLSFLVGVYGMNFEYIPELQHRYGYFVLWAVMLSIIGGMLVYFRRHKWL